MNKAGREFESTAAGKRHIAGRKSADGHGIEAETRLSSLRNNGYSWYEGTKEGHQKGNMPAHVESSLPCFSDRRQGLSRLLFKASWDLGSLSTKFVNRQLKKV